MDFVQRGNHLTGWIDSGRKRDPLKLYIDIGGISVSGDYADAKELRGAVEGLIAALGSEIERVESGCARSFA